MWENLRSLQKQFQREIATYQLLRKDGRVPKRAKWLLGLAIAYALSPVDLIPDFIPVIGYLDDVIIVPLLVMLALKMIPKELVDDCRRRAEANLTR